jgi:hypothetical protein
MSTPGDPARTEADREYWKRKAEASRIAQGKPAKVAAHVLHEIGWRLAPYLRDARLPE